MCPTPQEFYRATNPAKTLDIGQFPDQNYYVDFSAVRGGEVIQELKPDFDQLSETEKLAKIKELFNEYQYLDELCRISGGHVRNLLLLLNAWIIKEKQLPLSLRGLEIAVANQIAEKTPQITKKEWALLKQVHQDQELGRDSDYSKFIYTLAVFEYRDNQGAWYAANPILIKTGKLD